MKIAQYLGFRYIWIDSLCIIQDSQEDWRKEAGTMGQVYSYSFCNISATAGSDGSQGLFFDRHPLAIRPFKILIDAGGVKGLYYLFNPRLWADGVDDAPLNRRAWVVQERQLSPCNLHFGSTQIYWECRQRLACETHPITLPKMLQLIDSNKLDPDGAGARIRSSLGLPADPSLNNYTFWGSIVATYTKGGLSFEADKLVTLSGIAKQIQQVIGDQYLAGMWRNHFADQLLWTAEYASTRSRKSMRPRGYRAPTWSWCAIDGEIGRLGHIRYADGRGIMIDVLAVAVDPVAADPFGQIKTATLQARGKLAKAAMNVSAQPSSAGMCKFGVYAETLLKTDFYIHQDVAFEGDTGISVDSLDNLYLLPVRDPAVYPAGDFGVRGLILQPVGDQAGVFRRFGAFSVFFQKDDSILAKACEYFDSQAENCGLEYYKDCKNGYKYTMTIV